MVDGAWSKRYYYHNYSALSGDDNIFCNLFEKKNEFPFWYYRKAKNKKILNDFNLFRLVVWVTE